MQPDHRHGTISGYKHYRCRCDECRDAAVRYDKRRRWLLLQGHSAMVPAHGFKRRVHALMAIGWTQAEIAAAMGIAGGNLALKLRTNMSVHRATHKVAAEVYERLCMTVPDHTGYRGRTRAVAARNGWAPPLAWDDIDDANELHFAAEADEGRNNTIDHVVVVRILNGDGGLAHNATNAERGEVVRRWPTTGRPINDLARLTGWKPERYGATA